jgi:hypothetical protein
MEEEIKLASKMFLRVHKFSLSLRGNKHLRQWVNIIVGLAYLRDK